MDWTALDFIFAAVMFGTLALALTVVWTRGRARLRLRISLTVVAILVFLAVWAQGAVGIVD